MNILDAQKDMRYGFFGGGVGIFVSGMVWLIAGTVALNGATNPAIWTLLIGGVLISPISDMLTKALGRPSKSAPGNPLVTLAMESTIWMVFCLPLAYALAQANLMWFFPAMLLIIGGRYLTFSRCMACERIGYVDYYLLRRGLPSSCYMYRSAFSPLLAH